MPPTPRIVRNLAEEIIKDYVNKNWASTFVRRHRDELKSVYLRNIDNQRRKAEYLPLFEFFFKLLYDKMEEHNITADNLYNWDEKGFLIGVGKIYRRIMTRQDSWTDTLISEDKAFFGSSTNRWSDNSFGMVDGHSSYVNMEFLEYCIRHRIVVIVLPPHTTHKLQLLDVSVFSPLGTAYRIFLNDKVIGCLGFMSMSKRDFWEVFYKAWMKSFTESNMQAAWKDTSIFPYDPEVVLGTLRRLDQEKETDLNQDQDQEQEQESLAKVLKTPKSAKSFRRFQHEFNKNASTYFIKKLFKANLELAARDSVNNYMIYRLIESLKNEKRKRSRGKRLDLSGVATGGAQFFSTEEILAAKARARAKEEQEQAEQAEKAENKRAKKARQVEEALQKEISRKEAKDERERRRTAQAQAKAVSQDFQLGSRAKNTAEKAQKPGSKSLEAAKAQEVVEKGGDVSIESSTEIGRVVDLPVRLGRHGRQIRLLQRFD
ncbi:uncharacterized protein BP5553_09034 [Venustampulla echinocandica]|uniref:HTH CENPB-type domain-containing protein n=1 Tax=Venustampulla echinocandica TaxID=2656787 RepID=A0A370TDN4_9HELO|nr:uncharacterized protein BP5553_09034 [Venustampulla echinocandica]RDL32578.1 hypothetical protein BP5553_09034 [Venustampulla echinocandica]